VSGITFTGGTFIGVEDIEEVATVASLGHYTCLKLGLSDTNPLPRFISIKHSIEFKVSRTGQFCTLPKKPEIGSAWIFLSHDLK
jgi:hypothetical protein